MAFYGKLFNHQSNENFEAFVESLKLQPEQTAAYLNFKASQKIEKNGDEYVITTLKPQGPTELRFKSGVEFDEKIGSDITAKTTFTVDGNKVTQVQKFGDKWITYAREYTPDKLVVSITSNFWDGSAKRIYAA